MNRAHQTIMTRREKNNQRRQTDNVHRNIKALGRNGAAGV
jgi:hypothetical protein